jgi:hypothetical protein
VSFSFFDPGPPAGYLLAVTFAIPLTVIGGTAAPPDVPEPTEAKGEPSSLLTPALVAAGFLLLALIGVWFLRRAGRTEEVDPAELRALNAAAEFRSTVREPGADLAAAFADYLAAHLRCTSAQVISPELGARLLAAGVPEDTSTRTANLLETLVAMNYGSRLSPEAATAESTRMIDELEPQFRSEHVSQD